SPAGLSPSAAAISARPRPSAPSCRTSASRQPAPAAPASAAPSVVMRCLVSIAIWGADSNGAAGESQPKSNEKRTLDGEHNGNTYEARPHPTKETPVAAPLRHFRLAPA